MSQRPSAAERTADLFSPETMRRAQNLCDACEKRPAVVQGRAYRFCAKCAPPPSQRRKEKKP